MAREVCGSCMQNMRGGRCVNRGCSAYVAEESTHDRRVGGNSGRFKTKDSLLGHPNTGLVADRGSSEERSSSLDDVKYQGFKGKSDERSAKHNKAVADIKKKKARKEANKAIGKFVNEVGREGADSPEGTKTVKVKTWSGTRYKVIKDKDSDIWKD